MGFMDSIRKLTHPYSDAEDDYDEYDDELPEEEPVRRSSSYSRSTSSAPAAPVESNAGRVVSISPGVQLQVILVKPDRFDQVSEIADHLRAKEAVVLNLENTTKDIARRLVDFLSGVAYALDGKIKKVAVSTYLITPYNVSITGEWEDSQEAAKTYI
ncbi:MAG: cell division protein SepF [Oscillospiraceae bacterium]|nr:cell division protein SepF [Oscillospiraceae bacterium]